MDGVKPGLLVIAVALLGAAFAAKGAPSANGATDQGPSAALFEAKCLTCHDRTMALATPRSRTDWQATVKRMVALGAPVSADEADRIVGYLAHSHGIRDEAASSKDAAAGAVVPPATVFQEGLPAETRPGELHGAQPAFAGQTRAPYHKTHDITLTTIATGLDNPWSLAFLPDGAFLVTEKPGALRIITATGKVLPPIAGVPPVFHKTQAGLLDVVLDRKFARNRRIFISYMDSAGPDTAWIRIASATLDRKANALRNVKPIFTAVPAITTAQPGNGGGRLAIARDGTIFATIGDRVPVSSAGWNKAQSLDTHLGKIIHINPDGTAAAGNPFSGRKGALPEIWSIGHRSQQGLAFSPSGALWETEHGPRGGDELNRIRRGANYGWPLIAYGIEYRGELIHAGRTQAPGLEQPAYYWDPVIAPSGFAFYRGALFPKWRGSVLIGGLRGERLVRLGLSAKGKVTAEEPLLLDLRKRIRDVRIGPDGAVYILTDEAHGSLLKLTPAK